MKTLLTAMILALSFTLAAQRVDVPVQVKLKDGTVIEAKHFGKKKCGDNIYVDNNIFIRGYYLGKLTEIKDFKDIDKIVLDGFKAAPATSVGNEKATLIVYKKDGVSAPLEDAEIVMSCYSAGDKYNQLIVEINNPFTNQIAEITIDTKKIQTITFK
jgi:hypothetical protein